MNETIAIAEDTIEVDNPQKLYGKVSVIIGTIVILIGLVVLVININRENSILTIVLSLITMALGLSKLVSGGFALKKLWVPLHAPKGFINTDLLVNSIKAGEIDTYYVDRSLATEILRLFGSKNVYYMHGDAKNIARGVGNRVIMYSILIICLIA